MLSPIIEPRPPPDAGRSKDDKPPRRHRPRGRDCVRITSGSWPELPQNQEIAQYLTWARPILLDHSEFMIGDPESPLLTGALWIGDKGQPLTQGAVALAIAQTTEMVLGIALRPHDFRRCAATTAAYRAGQLPHLASALLQHRDRRVTDEHYNRASSYDAAAKFSRIVATLRS